jgi:hypothetical protein
MDAKLPVSILLLARDERALLASLLPTLGWAAEVVLVLDPAGDPDLAAVGEAHGARVSHHAFAGFGPQRAYALAQCTQPWVLWIDADERLAPGAVAALRAVMSTTPGEVAYTLRRVTWFLGAPVRFCGWQGERVLRLFPRAGARFDDAPVHEQVHPGTAAVVALDATLEHHSYPDWQACVDKPTRYARLGAERAWAEGRRAGVGEVLLRPPLRFLRQYLVQGGVFDGWRGVLVCAFGAWQVFLKYGALWDRGRRVGGA